MDALADYESSSDEESPSVSQNPVPALASSALPSVAAMQARILQRTLDICPATPDGYAQLQQGNSTALALTAGQTLLKHNPRYEDLCRPIQGPSPDGGDAVNAFTRNIRTGHVQKYNVNMAAFMDEFNQYNHYGTATDVNGNVITNKYGYASKKVAKKDDTRNPDSTAEAVSSEKTAATTTTTTATTIVAVTRRKRKKRRLIIDDDGTGGPWAKMAAHDMPDPEDRKNRYREGNSYTRTTRLS